MYFADSTCYIESRCAEYLIWYTPFPMGSSFQSFAIKIHHLSFHFTLMSNVKRHPGHSCSLHSTGKLT